MKTSTDATYMVKVAIFSVLAVPIVLEQIANSSTFVIGPNRR